MFPATHMPYHQHRIIIGHWRLWRRDFLTFVMSHRSPSLITTRCDQLAPSPAAIELRPRICPFEPLLLRLRLQEDRVVARIVLCEQYHQQTTWYFNGQAARTGGEALLMGANDTPIPLSAWLHCPGDLLEHCAMWRLASCRPR